MIFHASPGALFFILIVAVVVAYLAYRSQQNPVVWGAVSVVCSFAAAIIIPLTGFLTIPLGGVVAWTSMVIVGE